MKKVIIVLLCLLFCTACNKTLNTNLEATPKDSVLLDFIFNDSFSGFTAQSLEGEEFEKIPLEKDNKIVFYLSERCGACVEVLRYINRFEKLFCSEKLDYVIYWADEVPENLLEKNSIPKEKNFSLKGKAKLGAVTPAFFILDKENIVKFSTNNFEMIIKKVISDQIISKEDMLENANNYILSKISKSSPEKVNLVYFSMSGCSDCEKVEKTLEVEKIKSAFEIITIYSKDEIDDKEYIDKYNMFLNIYDIKWYPSFLILNEDGTYKFIGETSSTVLEDILINSIN